MEGSSEIAELAGLPEYWRREFEGGVLIPVTTGMSGASIYRVRVTGAEDRFLKIGQGAAAPGLRREIQRTRWLRSRGISVPAILMDFDGTDVAAVLVTGISGSPLGACRCEPDRGVRSIASALAKLHGLPIDDCPFDETIRTRLARAREDIERGLVDPGEFSSRNRGLSPSELYRRLVAAIPPGEDPVVIHGDATLDNILVNENGAVGFIDCGHAGRGDRYIDLAVVTEDIEAQFGSRAVGAFLGSYRKARWNSARALFFRDLYELF